MIPVRLANNTADIKTRTDQLLLSCGRIDDNDLRLTSIRYLDKCQRILPNVVYNNNILNCIGRDKRPPTVTAVAYPVVLDQVTYSHGDINECRLVPGE